MVKQLIRRRAIKDGCISGITFTTRNKRPGEKEGRDYFYVAREEFRILKAAGFFLESTKVLENHYGTPKYFYELARKEKKDLVLCIDVKGGMYLKKNFRPGRIVTVFISAPSEGDLYKRLRKRVERKDFIEQRISLAKKELQFARYYDYLVINKNIQESLEILEGIFLAEKVRRSR